MKTVRFEVKIHKFNLKFDRFEVKSDRFEFKIARFKKGGLPLTLKGSLISHRDSRNHYILLDKGQKLVVNEIEPHSF